MQLVLEPTETFALINGTPFRVWRGWTDQGVDVVAYVGGVQPQTDDPEYLAAFDAELNEQIIRSRKLIGVVDLVVEPLKKEEAA